MRLVRLLSLAAAAAWIVLAGAGSGPADSVGIAAAKLLPDGAQVSLTGAVASTCASDFCQILHQFSAGVSQGNVQSSAINEASGVAASRRNPGVLWVHNDSGDSARVFAMTTAGVHLGIYNLTGASAVDWEDIAIGPGPVTGAHYIYAGDIGDNNGVRANIVVYRVQEPAVSPTQQPVNVNLGGVQAFTLQYEHGARDAETLMVDPTTGDLYIVTKRESRSRVYRAAASSLTTSGTVMLYLVAELTWNTATGGDISPQGDEIIIRNYSSAYVWARPPGSNLWDAFSGTQYPVTLIVEPQGEAIGYNANGSGFYTTSEVNYQPIYYYTRTPPPSPTAFYIEEPLRCAGIRVAAAPGGIAGLVRGSSVDAQGRLGTTSDGERQLVDAVVQVLPPAPSPPKPLGLTGRALGGSDFGDPPLGQYGVTGGKGLNSVGLLVKTWGTVTGEGFPQPYIELSDGSGAIVRVDTTGLRTPPRARNRARVTGTVGLKTVGPNRTRLLMPRTDADVVRY